MRKGFYFLILWLYIWFRAPLQAQGEKKKDPAALIAGTYEGIVFVEILQQEMKVNAELIRTHKDSVKVKVINFELPTRQKFNYQSKNLSVKEVNENGKRICKLYISFLYNYNGMPMEVVANGKFFVNTGQLEAEVKAMLMGMMETKVTYKGKKRTNK